MSWCSGGFLGALSMAQHPLCGPAGGSRSLFHFTKEGTEGTGWWQS